MLKVLFLAALALFVFAAGSSWIALFPAVPDDLGGIENLDARAEKVRIAVDDRDGLDGWLLHGNRAALIVIFHGYGRNHTRAWRYAQFLQRAGYSILTVDFRSSRSWNRKPTTIGWYELNDARAVLDWVAAHPVLSRYALGLFGESLGGSVALVAASRHPEVRAICTDAAFADGRRALEDASRRRFSLPAWPTAPLARALGRAVTKRDPYELDAVAAARAVADRPTYFIHSTGDDRFHESQARELWRAAGSDPDGLWILGDEVGHNESWLRHREEYERRVLAFFRSHVTGPPAEPWSQARLDRQRRLREGLEAAGRAVTEGAKAAARAVREGIGSSPETPAREGSR